MQGAEQDAREEEQDHGDGSFDEERKREEIPPALEAVTAREESATFLGFNLPEQEALTIRVRQQLMFICPRDRLREQRGALQHARILLESPTPGGGRGREIAEVVDGPNRHPRRHGEPGDEGQRHSQFPQTTSHFRSPAKALRPRLFLANAHDEQCQDDRAKQERRKLADLRQHKEPRQAA